MYSHPGGDCVFIHQLEETARMEKLLEDADWADDRLTEMMDMPPGIKPYYLSPLIPSPPVLAMRYNKNDGLYLKFEGWL